MRNLFKQQVRWSVLALGLTGAVTAWLQFRTTIAPVSHWLWNEIGLWGGLFGAIASLVWLAAVIGAYRVVDGEEAVADWLDSERESTWSTGIAPALVAAACLVTTEELLLRSILLPIGGGLAVVAAAGLLRLKSGRRSTVWGIAQGLLLTALALFTGNVMSAWIAHLITEGCWLAYLRVGSWQTIPQDQYQGSGAPTEA